MIRRLSAGAVAGLLALVTALVGVPVAPAAAAPCSGVVVVVDFAALGARRTGCATDFSSGTKALLSAGFRVGRASGMICTIDALPKPCAISNDAYWSYWHATASPEGTIGQWSYSTLGPDSYRPVRGDVEGWRFGDGSLTPGQAEASASPTPTPATPAAPVSSPWGTLVGLGLVASGAIALLGWWLRKGRHR